MGGGAALRKIQVPGRFKPVPAPPCGSIQTKARLNRREHSAAQHAVADALPSPLEKQMNQWLAQLGRRRPEISG
jgi:hypothetical protein